MSKVKENVKVLDIYSKYAEGCVECVDEEDEKEVLSSLGLTRQKFNDFDESCTNLYD